MIRRFYDKKRRAFFSERYFVGGVSDIVKIGNFDDLMEVTEGSLDGVDLTEYDISKIDTAKYDISNAVISTKDLKKIGSFDDSFYMDNVVSIGSENYPGVSQDHDDIVEYSSDITEYESIIHLERGEVRLFYITDVHLDHKIRKKFPEPVSKNEIFAYIWDIVGKLYRDYSAGYAGHVRVLIGGDVSHSFEITKMFYSLMSEVFFYTDPIAILGNHELWDYPSKCDSISSEERLDVAIGDYEEMFDRLHMSFVHNMLYDVFKRRFVRREELIAASKEEIRDFCNHSRLLILGGIGFSGNNPSFNFNSGLYRDTLTSREQEISESKKFEELYKKLLDTVPDIPLVVFTHMSKECWTDLPYNPNWIYISGHDHRNSLRLDEDVTHYHDNQIGYDNTSIHLKSLLLSASYDIFRDYPDGIHEITRAQYLDFNRGLSIHCSFNREGDIRLLKRDGLYCFILLGENGQLSILNGGRPKKLKKTNIQYYYDNLVVYSKTAERFFSDYNSKLKEISAMVKSIGGTGTIHGSIVDISFFSHLFLNPFDGSVIPYSAQDMVRKTVYRDVPTLLEECERPLLKGYSTHVNSNSTALSLLKSNPSFKGKKIQYTDTWMYSCSYIFKGFQYLTDSHVIRIWKDELLTSKAGDDAILEVLGISGLLEGSR